MCYNINTIKITDYSSINYENQRNRKPMDVTNENK